MVLCRGGIDRPGKKDRGSGKHKTAGGFRYCPEHAETDTPAPVYDLPAPVSVHDTETGYIWVQIDEQTIEISQAD